MPKVTYVHPDGTQDVLDVAPGTSVMLAAITRGIDGIVAECGGSAMCATCHVYVDPEHLAKLPPPDANEEAMLDSTAAERHANSRLSCQIEVTPALDGLVVRLPDRQI